MRQMITSLTKKLDTVSAQASSLQTLIDSKERELARMRSIHSIRLGQAKAGGWDPTQKTKKRDKSVQTVVKMEGEEREMETQGFVYEID